MEILRDINKRGISKVYVKESLLFNKEDVIKYIDMFNELKNEGYIMATSYTDLTWRIPCTATNNYYPLTFDIDIYQESKQALKNFCLILLVKGKSVGWVSSVVEVLKKLIVETRGFTEPSRLINYLSDNVKKYFISRTLLNFLDFYPVVLQGEIRIICESISAEERGEKELPPFIDIFIFNEIVNDYFRNASNEDQLRFKPIQLWWAITNIIPMRPNEFLKLKSDCVSMGQHGQYWITLSRSKKVKQSFRDIPPIQTIQINKEIFDMVKNFKSDLFHKGITSEYLLPQSFYEIVSFNPNKRKSRSVEDRWNLRQFRNQLRHFHKKVVRGSYEEKYITEILPSHTRHLAIINLFLQGFNMLSIARMAGHEELYSQSNYYNHAENFVESYVFCLIKSSFSDDIGKRMGDGLLGWRRETIDRGKKFSFEEADETLIKVDYGYCEDKDEFPNNCSEDCRHCPFYVFKPSVNEHAKAIKWLENYSEDIGTKINDIVQAMISTSKALSGSYRPDLDESLQSKSRQLQQLMDHKTALEYKLLGDH